MAARFIDPISTPYQPQYVPLPLEMIGKNLEATQAKYDNTLGKLQEDAFALKDTAWTEGAQSIVEPYRQKQSEIVNNLMRTGKTGSSLRDIKNLKEKWVNDERVQNQLGWLEYEKQLEKQMQDPKWQSAYDPLFYKNKQWNKVNLSDPEQFAQYKGKNPSPIYDETQEFYSKTIGENLKGYKEEKGLVGNLQYDANADKFFFNKISGGVHYIDPNNEPYTMNAITSMAQMIADPNRGTHPQMQYSRDVHGVTDEQKGVDYLKQILSPYFTASKTYQEDRQYMNPTGDGNGKGNTNSDDISNIIFQGEYGTLHSKTITQIDDEVIAANAEIAKTERTATNLIFREFYNNKDFIKEFAPMFGYDPNKLSQITEQQFNEIVEKEFSDPAARRQYDESGKYIGVKTKGEVLMDKLSSFALNQYYKKLNDNTITPAEELYYSNLMNTIGSVQSKKQHLSKLFQFRQIVNDEYTDYFKDNAHKVLEDNKDLFDYAKDIFKGQTQYLPDLVSKLYVGIYEYAFPGSDPKNIELSKKKDAIEFVLSEDYDKFKAWNDRRVSQGWESHEMARSYDFLHDLYIKGRQGYTPTAKLENPLYLISEGSKNPIKKFEESLLNNYQKMNETALLRRIAGNTSNLSQGLKSVYNNNMINHATDEKFDTDKIAANQIKELDLDLDASDGPHYILTFQQGDDKNKAVSKLRIKLDDSARSSFYEEVLIPMLGDKNQQVKEKAGSILVQMNMDPKESGFLKTIAATRPKNGQVFNHEFDFSLQGQYANKFTVIKTVDGTMVKDETGKKVPVDGSSYQSIVDAMGAMWLTNSGVYQNSSGGRGGSSGGGKPTPGARK